MTGRPCSCHKEKNRRKSEFGQITIVNIYGVISTVPSVLYALSHLIYKKT